MIAAAYQTVASVYKQITANTLRSHILQPVIDHYNRTWKKKLYNNEHFKNVCNMIFNLCWLFWQPSSSMMSLYVINKRNCWWTATMS